MNGLPYFVKAGLTWAAATIAFGLLPLWLRAFGLALRPGSGFDVEGVLKEGMLGREPINGIPLQSEM